MGRLMIQNEAQGLGGALEHLLFLKISGDLVLATGRSLGTELVDLNTKRVTRIIGEGKPADALCALPSDGMSDTLLVGGPTGSSVSTSRRPAPSGASSRSGTVPSATWRWPNGPGAWS